jgi:hypothetical protein
MKKAFCCCIIIAAVSVTRSQVNYVNYSYSIPTTTYKDGVLTGYFPWGDTEFVCNASKNILDGIWRSYYPGGQICDSGRLKKNVPDGVWKSWYPSGQLRMQAEVSAKYLTDARILIDRIRDRRSNSDYPVISGMSNNISLKNRVDYNTIQEKFGYDPPFECLYHGSFATYLPNGFVRDSGFVNEGDKDGVWQEWDASNKLKVIGFYKRGVRCREWQYYDPQGKLLYIQRYSSEGEERERVTLK